MQLKINWTQNGSPSLLEERETWEWAQLPSGLYSQSSVLIIASKLMYYVNLTYYVKYLE